MVGSSFTASGTHILAECEVCVPFLISVGFISSVMGLRSVAAEVL